MRRFLLVKTWLWFALLGLYGYELTNSYADESPLPARATTFIGPFGKLTPVGNYPDASSSIANSNTVTELADNKLLFHGLSVSSYIPNTKEAALLRSRIKSLSTSLSAETKLWDPKQQGWVNIGRPPECPYNNIMATATLLNDGNVLIAGGLCDRARMADDRLPHVPHTALSLWNAKNGQWLPAPAMLTSRILHTATRLKDNSVLIVGGLSDPESEPTGIEPVLDAVERYQDGKLSLIAPLKQARARHTATALNDGSLLIVGGFDAEGKPIASVELWDRYTLHDLPPLHIARYGHTATLLDDGRVMIAGGLDAKNTPLGSVEIYDPTSHSWSFARPLLVPLYDHAATRLSNGNVLIAGGTTIADNKAMREAMLWDKNRGEWLPAGTRPEQTNESGIHSISLLPLANGDAKLFGSSWIMQWTADKNIKYTPVYGERSYFGLTALRDGKVLISGGISNNAFLDEAEIYDPVSGNFTLTGRMQHPRHSHSSLLLDDGSVLVAGGWVRSPDDYSQPQGSSPELWDPTTGTWRILNDIRFEWRDRVLIKKLDNGAVLFFASHELADPDKIDGPVVYRAWQWDPKTGITVEKPVPLMPRAKAGIVIRPDGSVFVVGGYTRIQQPAYHCPLPTLSKKRTKQHIAKVNEHIDTNRQDYKCHDEPSYWTEDREPRVELWDSRSDTLTKLNPPPTPYFNEYKTLALKNGNVILADYAPLNVYDGLQKLPVFMWNSTTGTWSELPSLNSDDSLNLLELADGSLLSRSSRLLPGASSWERQKLIQVSGNNQPVMLTSGDLLSIDTQPPYIARYSPKNAGWEAVLSKKQPPVLLNPALAPLADGRLMVIANTKSNNTSKQKAYIWDLTNDTWINAGQLARDYGSGHAM